MKYKRFIYKLLSFIPDKLYLKIMFIIKKHETLNFKKPKTFNEKLQWLKINDRKDIYTTMVDKYEAKKFVGKIIGEDYIIPTIGVFDNFDDIDFNALPNQFVMKCTHDSSGIVICKNKDKLDYEKARKKIQNALSFNYYFSGREWPYKNVKPRIIVEQYLEDKETKELRDYKFFCCNGKMMFFKIDFNRYSNHQANYYDSQGKLMHFGEKVCPPDYSKKLSMPQNLEKMIVFSERLSQGTVFLRVDFYEVNGKLFFGELTFYPGSGFGSIEPREWDKKIGELINCEQLVNNSTI